MILGVGIDLCDAGRMEKSITRQSFLDHVFAPEEQALLAALGDKHRAETAAANFAAKEAFLKAAGTGLGGFAMPELAVRRTVLCPDRRCRRLGCGAEFDRACQLEP